MFLFSQKATSTGNNSHLEAYMSDKAEQATHATESALFALGKLAHQAGKPFSNVNPCVPSAQVGRRSKSQILI